MLFGQKRRQAFVALLLGVLPQGCGWPGPGSDLVVVLDGGSGRIAAADRVGPADWPTPSPAERRKLLRDGLRLALWRAAGSTGAWLAPQVAARKRAVCGV